MELKSFIRQSGALTKRRTETEMFKDLDATELYCPRCKQAVPVRKRLLLVLPEGDKYEYLCAFVRSLLVQRLIARKSRYR